VVVSSALLYIALFVCSFLVGIMFPVVRRWVGLLCVWWLVGVLVGAVWLGLFCGYWSFSEASKILLGAMLYSSFKWLLKENFFVNKVYFFRVEDDQYSPKHVVDQFINIKYTT